jgi:predicted cobalt transporter CbtA
LSIVTRFDPARPRSVAVAAVLVGLLGGLLAAVFLEVAGEPSIREAINIEQANIEQANAAMSHAGHGGGAGAGGAGGAQPVIVSRSVQRGVGLFGAYAVTGAAFGLLVAVGFWVMRGGQPDPFRRALAAGAIVAGAVTVAPWLKYPPNPPAVGSPDTLARRQILYVSVICLAAVLGVAAAALSTRLRRDGWPPHRRVLALVALVVVPLAAAFALLPPPPDAITVPANLLWRFRLASLSGNLLLWGVLTLGFGALMAEAAERSSTSTAGPSDGTSDVSTRSP